jgi:hypothetical protein
MKSVGMVVWLVPAIDAVFLRYLNVHAIVAVLHV